MKLGQFSRALDDCEQALQADPKYDKVQLRRGQVRRQLGQLQGAIDDFKAVIAITNDEPT
jgi:tetratricopeptide (TPR) repeat protein